MRRTLFVLIALALGLGAPLAAQGRGFRRELGRDRVELRHDRRELLRDRIMLRGARTPRMRFRAMREFRWDRRDLRWDRRDLRRDRMRRSRRGLI